MCGAWERPLNERESEIMDNLVELEDSIPRETMLILIYLAGYVERNGDNEDIDDKYGLDVSQQQCRMLVNIFLKRFSFMMTPNSAREARIKVELKNYFK